MIVYHKTCLLWTSEFGRDRIESRNEIFSVFLALQALHAQAEGLVIEQVEPTQHTETNNVISHEAVTRDKLNSLYGHSELNSYGHSGHSTIWTPTIWSHLHSLENWQCTKILNVELTNWRSYLDWTLDLWTDALVDYPRHSDTHCLTIELNVYTHYSEYWVSTIISMVLTESCLLSIQWGLL